jgi:hypothetical protein
VQVEQVQESPVTPCGAVTEYSQLQYFRDEDSHQLCRLLSNPHAEVLHTTSCAPTARSVHPRHDNLASLLTSRKCLACSHNGGEAFAAGLSGQHNRL